MFLLTLDEVVLEKAKNSGKKYKNIIIWLEHCAYCVIGYTKKEKSYPNHIMELYLC